METEKSSDHPAGSMDIESEAGTYCVVTQVKSDRVIYFTDDAAFVPQESGDWFYVSVYRGLLPPTITLRNCWSWRFDGNKFTKAPETPVHNTAELLRERNRQTLFDILNEKVNELRKPYVSELVLGETLRIRKRLEAQAYLSGQRTAEPLRALEAVAVARAISMEDAAQLICRRAEQTEDVLIATERIRERFAQLIGRAETNDDLLLLKKALLEDIYPELSQRTKFALNLTVPVVPDEPLSASRKAHEVGCLKAQLREHINQERRRIDESYLGHVELLKFKGDLARWFLSSTGEKPSGFELLEAYATARSLSLESASRAILEELANASKVLSATEVLKDKMLAEIERIENHGELVQVQEDLTKVTHRH